MSYQDIKKRLEELNKRDFQEAQPINPVPQQENPLLLKYKEQETKYQELKNEIDQYRNRIAVSNLQNSEITNIEEPKKELKKEKNQLNIDIHSIDQISSFLYKNRSNLETAKKQIVTRLYQEAREMNQLFYDATITEEDRDFIKGEIQSIISLITWIQNYKPKEKEETYDEQKKPDIQLIYLNSLSGRIIPYDELESIAVELRPEYKSLLEDMKQNVFRGYKQFKDKKLAEVKTRHARIFFRRLNETTYLISKCLVKDMYTNSQYRNDLIRLNNYLDSIEEEITLLLKSPYFIEEQKKIEEDIWKLCEKTRGDKNDKPRLLN